MVLEEICPKFTSTSEAQNSFQRVFIEHPSGTSTVPDTEGTAEEKKRQENPSFPGTNVRR